MGLFNKAFHTITKSLDGEDNIKHEIQKATNENTILKAKKNIATSNLNNLKLQSPISTTDNIKLTTQLHNYISDNATKKSQLQNVITQTKLLNSENQNINDTSVSLINNWDQLSENNNLYNSINNIKDANSNLPPISVNIAALGKTILGVTDTKNTDNENQIVMLSTEILKEQDRYINNENVSTFLKYIIIGLILVTVLMLGFITYKKSTFNNMKNNKNYNKNYNNNNNNNKINVNTKRGSKNMSRLNRLLTRHE